MKTRFLIALAGSTALAFSGFAAAQVKAYKWKDKNGAKQEKADFHNIVCFGRIAENVGQYMRKGNQIMVEGRMTTRS